MANYMERQKKDAGALAKETAQTVNKMLAKNRAAIMATLPQGFNLDRMCRSLINAISTTPSIAECTPASIFLSSVRAFSLGIEPNGALQEGYLVPFWNSKKACNEAQFMPGYRGLINLARRSGEIATIYARSVHAKDVFEVVEGTERSIIHKPNYTQERGEYVCFYAVFNLKSGEMDFEVMTVAEVEAIRARSKAAKSGPWVTDFEEMAKKTVLRRLLKRAPMSVELAQSVNLDNKAAMGDFDGNGNDIIDIDGFDMTDAQTPAELQQKVNADKTAELREKIAAKNAATAADDLAAFAPMIQSEITRSGAPTTVDEVIDYVKRQGVKLAMDSDFAAIVNAAAEAELV